MDETLPPDELAERLLGALHRVHRWSVATVQADRGELDLSLRQVAVLFLIGEGAAFPSQIARKLRVTPAVVTGLLDRLEQRGYVRRTADAHDRRRFRLVLTDSGQEASRAVGRMLAGEIAAHLGRATAAELAALERALPVLERVADDLERGAPPEGPSLLDDDGWNDRDEAAPRVARAAG